LHYTVFIFMKFSTQEKGMSTQLEYNPIQVSGLVDGIHRIMDEADRMSKEEYEDMKEGYTTFENSEVDRGFFLIEEVVRKRVEHLLGK